LQNLQSWKLLDVKFPKGIKFSGGLTMLPMWHYPQKLENISQDEVLIFGGGFKEVFSLDLSNNIVNVVHEKAVESSSPSSPSGSGKTLSLSRDDWFIA
jgi:hypothetical protein